MIDNKIIKDGSIGFQANGNIVLKVELPQLFIQNNFNELYQQGKMKLMPLYHPFSINSVNI